MVGVVVGVGVFDAGRDRVLVHLVFGPCMAYLVTGNRNSSFPVLLGIMVNLWGKVGKVGKVGKAGKVGKVT